MYEIYDLIDDRTVRLFPSRQALRRFLTSATGDWFVSRGYGWRRH